MKILNFYEFTALREGVIFSFYEPRICTELCRKGATLNDDMGRPSDFFYSSLVAQFRWDGHRDDCEAPIVDAIQGRWGMFDDTQMFAVYEQADIKAIKAQLP
jgi:hypothetical protein